MNERKPGSFLLRNANVMIPVLIGVAAALAALTFLVVSGRIGPRKQAQTETAAVSGSEVPTGGDGAASAAPSADNPAGTVQIGTGTVAALVRPFFLSPDIMAETASYEASVTPYTVNPDLSNVSWNKVSMSLDENRTALLAQNGFYLAAEAGDEFYDLYEMNRYFQIPSFVTTDSMMHTYHLYFSHLMKNTERQYLADTLKFLSDAMLQKSYAQLQELKGSEWQTAAEKNTAFFAVGSSLLDPSTQVPAEVQDLVRAELDLISATGNAVNSPIMSHGSASPVMEDYTQYIVRGYYEGDPQLEAYFRAMMWFGRMNFAQRDETSDRSALLITMALDDETLPYWEAIYSITSFFAGASDDCGYYEYRPILDAAYGAGVSVSDLPGNTQAWEAFHAGTAQMEPPKINSVVVIDTGTETDHNEEEKGFRFMGQRFSIDATVFSNLVYNRVGPDSANNKRMLPDALDVPAAFGSDAAYSILQSRGNEAYAGYGDNMQKLRSDLENAPDSLWNASLYSKWLDTLQPMLEPKGEGYPAFMQTDAWTRKNLQSFLGSYAELKHDTVLYSKQVMTEMGGGEDPTFDDRGYVEPEPEVFSRLAKLTEATSTGLAGYGMLSQEDADNLALLQQLSEQLSVIAQKELRNEVPTEEEFELIRSIGGQLEHFWQEVYKDETTDEMFSSRDFPAAIVTDIATDPNGTVLEVATGRVEGLYVIVPVDGQLKVAKGAVFSFYQFEHPAADRLTDSKWRQLLGIQAGEDGWFSNDASPYELEDWTSDFQYDWRDYQ